jgi:hypothetical protein
MPGRGPAGPSRDRARMTGRFAGWTGAGSRQIQQGPARAQAQTGQYVTRSRAWFIGGHPAAIGSVRASTQGSANVVPTAPS